MALARQLRTLTPTTLRRAVRRLIRVAEPARGQASRTARQATDRRSWWEAAELWQQAIRQASSPPASWYGQLGWVRQQVADWDGAVAAYREAIVLDGGKATWYHRLGRALEQLGDLDAAVQVYEEAFARFGDAPSVAYARLGSLHRKRGELEAAESVLAVGWERHGDEPKIAIERAELAMSYRVWHEAELWWRIAASLEQQLPPKRRFAMGRALQGQAKYEEALAAYDDALDSLETVDEPWAMEAMAEWEYRWEYCRLKAEGGPSQHPSLDVALVPAPAGPSRGTDTVGRFSAEVIHSGVLLTGWVEDPSLAGVSLCMDDHQIATIKLKNLEGTNKLRRPTFRFTVKHATLDHFPKKTTLTVRAQGGDLLAGPDGPDVQLEVPHGLGTLFDHMGEESHLTKKGTITGLVTANSTEDLRSSGMAAYRASQDLFLALFGIRLFLHYGTLLGCVRDDDFIPGDDDFDVGYISDASSPLELKQETLILVRRLLHAGYDVSTRISGGLFKLYVDGFELDVYPIWFADGLAWGYDAIEASRADFMPLVARNFQGDDVCIPKNAQQILRGVYGPTWGTPEPGFRHYRPAHVRRMLANTYLTPAEAKRLLHENLEARRSHAGIGQLLLSYSEGRPYVSITRR